MEWTIKDWSELTKEEIEQIFSLRSEVFIVEQDCVYQDLDGKDRTALHIIGRNEKDAIVAATTWKQRQDEEQVPQLVLMLDNFGPERSKEMVRELTEMGLRDAAVLEASGNIVFEDLEAWRECGVDVLSSSAINRGTAPLDVSMRID